MRKQRTWCLIAAGPAVTLTGFTNAGRDEIAAARRIRTTFYPDATIHRGKTTTAVAMQFSDNGSADTMGAAADAILQRLTACWPELRLTLLGLATLDGSPVLRHAAAADGAVNDAHTHYDALDMAVVLTDDDVAARVVITAEPTGHRFVIDVGDPRPNMTAVDDVLRAVFPRAGAAYALLTRIGGGYRLTESISGDSRVRRWGNDTIYPVFELLPAGGVDELLRHPELLDDWNLRSSVPLPMLRYYYDDDRLTELADRSSGPAGDTALTVALQLVYRVKLAEAQLATHAIVAATGHPRPALQLLDQLYCTGDARKLGSAGFRDTAIAVLRDSLRPAC